MKNWLETIFSCHIKKNFNSQNPELTLDNTYSATITQKFGASSKEMVE